MIYLRVSSTSEEQLERIAEMLLRERLAIDLNISRNIERLGLIDGLMASSKVSLLTGKTKGLLFGEIDRRLRELYPDDLPELYSLPIVHMDWEQANQLTSELTAA